MTEKKKSDLVPRLVTAIVAIPLLLGLILAGPAWGFMILVALAGAITTWEYCNITFGEEFNLVKNLATLSALALVLVMYFAPAYVLHAISGVGVLLFMVVLFGHKDQPRSSHHLSSAMMGVVYGGAMFGSLALVRQFTGDAGPCWVIIALAIIWGSDTGAYFSGRAFGKHKLSPTVSPNKSVEGAVGGLITSVLFCAGFNMLFAQTHAGAWEPMTLTQILILAIPGNILGQLGDLCESLIKRAHGVKDSGTIIYGHGGMMDRIDALIMASPWFYIFVTTFGPQAPK